MKNRQSKKHWSDTRQPKNADKYFPCPHYTDKTIPCHPGMVIYCSSCNIRPKHMNADIAPGRVYSASIINHCLFDGRKATMLAAVLEAFGRKVEDYARHIQGGLKDEEA